MRQLQDIKLADVDAERVRRDHADAIKEQQALWPVIVKNVVLVDSVATHVPNPLGRVPRAVTTSIVRGAIATAGRISETTDGVDRTRTLVITATGWGATITVDLLVWP